MIITDARTIDLKTHNQTKPIFAVQDDRYSHNLELTLLSGGEPWEIPENSSVVIRYSKPDGTGGMYDTLPDETAAWSASGNILTIALAPQVLTVPGAVTLSATLTQGTFQISTCSLCICVAEAVNAKIADSEEYVHVHSFLPAPAAAKLGQYIRISGVDGAGHVVAVEAVDAENEESGGTSGTAAIEQTAKLTLSESTGVYAQPTGLIQNQAMDIFLYAPIKLNQNMKILRMRNVPVNPYVAKIAYSNSATLAKDDWATVVILPGNDGEVIDYDLEIDTSYQYMYIGSEVNSGGSMIDTGAEYYIISSVPENQRLIRLAEQYEILPGDTLELFYAGIIHTGSLQNFMVECSCNVGNAYRKRYTFTPKAADEGNTYLLTLSLKDNFGNLLETASTRIKVIRRSDVSVSGNILCIGDSLTAEGTWVTEFRSRLLADGFRDAELIGTQSAGTAKHEGHSGWGYASFLAASEENPFWNPGTAQLDFVKYMEKLGLSGQKIDYCILLLGWNETALPEEAFRQNVVTFCTSLQSAFPDCRILFSGLQIPSPDGLGESYGCSVSWKEKCDFVHNLNHWYQNICTAIPNAKAVQLCSQFDTEHNMQTGSRPVNRRNPAVEIYCTNGIHPGKYGYLQIADAIYRGFMEL